MDESSVPFFFFLILFSPLYLLFHNFNLSLLALGFCV